MTQRLKPLIELHYLGSFDYFALFFGPSPVYLEACEHYQKGSYRNRSAIATAQGLRYLGLPLAGGKHQQKPVQEVGLSEEPSLVFRQHYKTLQTAYGSAPFWPHYGPLLQACWADLAAETRLFAINLRLFDFIWYELLRQEKQPYLLTQTYERGGDYWDLRQVLRPQSPAAWSGLCPYPQVFQDRLGFVSGLSVLDALFCLGGAWTARQLSQLAEKQIFI